MIQHLETGIVSGPRRWVVLSALRQCLCRRDRVRLCNGAATPEPSPRARRRYPAWCRSERRRDPPRFAIRDHGSGFLRSDRDRRRGLPGTRGGPCRQAIRPQPNPGRRARDLATRRRRRAQDRSWAIPGLVDPPDLCRRSVLGRRRSARRRHRHGESPRESNARSKLRRSGRRCEGRGNRRTSFLATEHGSSGHGVATPADYGAARR